MYQLSPHFTLDELLYTSHTEYVPEQENPPQEIVLNLQRLCRDVLEPIRIRWGPIRVKSGWRCSGLNSKVGGRPDSLHLAGLAADCFPLGFALVEAMEVAMADPRIPYDEVILEHDGADRWIHVQAPRVQLHERHLALQKLGKDYEAFDPNDKRHVVEL